ncbi:AAA family ATPase [Tessaracoccus sp.]|uniref:AAA family ATPase n=1 Tax=Tessaracoccus sp. TaxID=1971211 RepID=UPI00260C3DDB|nr:AAA family ATPase [Tessaracoccus sp.]
MRERPIAATGVLAAFCDANLLSLVDFHLARRVGDLAGEANPTVHLAFALAVRELRLGSVCVDLATAAAELRPEVDGEDDVDVAALPWPEPSAWLAAVAASPAVAGPDGEGRAFRLDGSLLYLDRYWRQERRLAHLLRVRSDAAPGEPLPLPELPTQFDDHQRAAVTAALAHTTTVITGGPGTGKTTIVTELLTALAPSSPRVALCAPTGKAAARLLTTVRGAGGATWGGTLHKLLGLRPRSAETEFGPDNPLPFDVVVVDETSMVSLELMALLLGALSPETRLILLGDPHQLRSVEAGAVLADIEAADDLVHAPGGAIARLVHNYRSNPQINAFASAILAGDEAAARAAVDTGPAIELISFDGETDPAQLATVQADALDIAEGVRAYALAGDGVRANAWLGRHRILCGHREGPFGVAHWARSVRGWLAGRLPAYGFDGRAYIGQPLLIQHNSDLFSNGDTAVVVAGPGGRAAGGRRPSRRPPHGLSRAAR